jgi:hypothetical protein
LCGSECLIVTRKERLYKFKGTPGIKVSSLSLSLSLIFCLSLSRLWQCVCPLISKLLGSKNLTAVLE